LLLVLIYLRELFWTVIPRFGLDFERITELFYGDVVFIWVVLGEGVLCDIVLVSYLIRLVSSSSESELSLLSDFSIAFWCSNSSAQWKILSNSSKLVLSGCKIGSSGSIKLSIFSSDESSDEESEISLISTLALGLPSISSRLGPRFSSSTLDSIL
jgi:hypothetical protein